MDVTCCAGSILTPLPTYSNSSLFTIAADNSLPLLSLAAGKGELARHTHTAVDGAVGGGGAGSGGGDGHRHGVRGGRRHERGQDGVRGPAGGAGAVPAVRAGAGPRAAAGLLRRPKAGAREEPQVPVRARQGQGRPQPGHQDQRHPRARAPQRLRRHPRQRLPLRSAPAYSSGLQRRRRLQPRRRQGLHCRSSQGQLDGDDRPPRAAGDQRRRRLLLGGDRWCCTDGAARRLPSPARA